MGVFAGAVGDIDTFTRAVGNINCVGASASADNELQFGVGINLVNLDFGRAHNQDFGAQLLEGFGESLTV